MDTKDIRDATGEAMRFANVRLGLVQTEISKRSGLSVVTISRLSTGARTANLEQLDALARAFGVNPGEFARDIYRRARELAQERAISAAEPTVTDLADVAEIHTADEGKKSTYGLAANKGTRKSDEPHAD